MINYNKFWEDRENFKEEIAEIQFKTINENTRRKEENKKLMQWTIDFFKGRLKNIK